MSHHSDEGRASGRQARTELPELEAQLRELDELIGSRLKIAVDADAVISHAREMYFLGEAIAHTIQKTLLAVAIERRLGFPKSDQELLGLFIDRGVLDVAQARRLRQFLELRFLSSRPLGKIDDAGVLELLRSRAEFVSHAIRALEAHL